MAALPAHSAVDSSEIVLLLLLLPPAATLLLMRLLSLLLVNCIQAEQLLTLHRQSGGFY
jgi:hypothetical protein